MKHLMMRFHVSLIMLLLASCGSNPPAPVIVRSPQITKPQPPLAANKTNGATTSKDWRPDTHVVKKGDTLFGIGLELSLIHI